MSRIKLKRTLMTVLSAVILYISSMALAGDMDIRNLNLHDYAYPGSEIVTETKQQYDAKLLMYSHDSADQVIKFYKEKNLKSNLVHPDPDRLVLQKMLVPNVPLTVIISWTPTRSRLNNNDLYRSLEIAAALGKHDEAELEGVRQRFDPLKDLFFPGDAGDILKKCRQSGSNAHAQNQLSMEEQGRRLQELAMQGRMDELREATKAFSSQQKVTTSGDVAGQWDKEISCLEELEKMSFEVEIEVTATRDDMLG